MLSEPAPRAKPMTRDSVTARVDTYHRQNHSPVLGITGIIGHCGVFVLLTGFEEGEERVHTNCKLISRSSCPFDAPGNLA